jgi:ABC-2 type transport system ATP-binding protein
MAAIELESVHYSYSGRPALGGVSFSIEEGKISALLGPNGGGKTTIFRILSTLLRPQSGSARVDGLDCARTPYLVRRRIGVVFQNRSLDLELSVEENLLHQGRLYGMRGKMLSDRAAYVAGKLGVTDRLRDRVRILSGGLQRRVDLAKALLHQPKILLLDEPTNGLDPKAGHDFWRHLRDLNRDEGMTILLTTHSMEEADRCDFLVILSEGKVVAEGSPAELKMRVGPDVVIVRGGSVEELGRRIAETFHLRPMVLDDLIRIEHENGHALVSELMERFPKEIESVTVGRASLEDVFIRQTGRRLGNDD